MNLNRIKKQLILKCNAITLKSKIFNTMNKFFLILFGLVLLFSCSSDTTEAESNFNIDLVLSTQSVEIDEQFTVIITSNEPMKGIELSFDNFVTLTGSYQDFGTSKTLTFNYNKLGDKTIYIRAKNAQNVFSTKEITVNITRGNAIKIKKLELISFYNINETCDPEFSSTDINRLADLKFSFSRSLIYNNFNGGYNMLFWYGSPVLLNQGNLTWDLESENLYLNPNAVVQFSLVDMDGEVLSSDLMNGPPSFKSFNFSNYLVTKPTEIIYSYPEINLEFKLFVEWVN